MTIRQLIGRFGKPLAIVLICIFAFREVKKSLPDIAKLHPQNYGLLVAGTALFVVTYFVQAIGWHFVLRALGQPIKFRDSARMFFISLIARWLPGRIWYTGARLYIGRQVGISVAAVGFGTILELIYILMGGIVVTIALAGSILRGLISSQHGQIVLWSGVALIIGGGMLVIRPSTFTSLSRLRPVRKIFAKLSGGEIDGTHVPDMTTASSLLLILYFTLYWISSGLAFGMLSAAFMPMTPEIWLACLPAFAGSWLIGFFSMITPAGIGVREFALTVMLKDTMGQSAALVMSIASRLVMTFLELILAGIAYLFLRDQFRQMPFAVEKKKPGAAKSIHPPTPPTGGLTFELPADILPDSNELLLAPDPAAAGLRQDLVKNRRGGHRDWSLVKRRPCIRKNAGAKPIARTWYPLNGTGLNGHRPAAAASALTLRKPSTKRRPYRSEARSKGPIKVPRTGFKKLPKIPALAEDQ